MASSYPAAVRAFVPNVDLQDVVYAADMNDVQDEISAVQTVLGVQPHVSAVRSAVYGSVDARLESLESSVSYSTHTHDHGSLTGLANDHDFEYVRRDSYGAKGSVLASSSAGAPVATPAPTSTNQVFAADLTQPNSTRWIQLPHSALAEVGPTNDPHSMYTRKDTLTNQGDMYVRGPSDVQRLAPGLNGQILMMSGGNPSWQSFTAGSTTHDGFADAPNSTIHTQYPLKSVLTTRGDIYIRNSAGNIVRFGASGSGQILTSDNSDATYGVRWMQYIIPHMHGWTIGGPVEQDSGTGDNYVNPLITHVPPGFSLWLVGIRYVLRAGTCTITVRQEGNPVAGFTSIPVGGGVGGQGTLPGLGQTNSPAHALGDSQRVNFSVDAATNADNLALTMYMEYRKT